jgi:uncharacterized protein
MGRLQKHREDGVRRARSRGYVAPAAIDRPVSRRRGPGSPHFLHALDRASPSSASHRSLKLHADVAPQSNTFNAYGDGWVEVNGMRQQASIIVMADRPVIAWPVSSLAELTAEHFAQVAAENPELVVFGSGDLLRFVHPRLLRPLIDRGIGVETMDVRAACRTYNILMQEGRRVAAALLLEPAPA